MDVKDKYCNREIWGVFVNERLEYAAWDEDIAKDKMQDTVREIIGEITVSDTFTMTQDLQAGFYTFYHKHGQHEQSFRFEIRVIPCWTCNMRYGC